MSSIIISYIQKAFAKTISYPASSFIIIRALVGGYLLFYYIKTLPYAPELYSNQGILPDVSLNWTHGIFPNILNLYDTPIFVTSIFLIGSLLSLLFGTGVLPRVSALFLWYLQTCLYNRNVLTDEPSQAYIGLLLIMFALLPQTKSIAYLFKKENWHKKVVVLMPYFIYMTPVFIFGITFTASAYDKMLSPSWEGGGALMLLLTMEIAKPSILLTFLKSHIYLTAALSYVALFSQFISFPLVVSGFYKIAIFIQFVAFCFAFLVLDINQVTLGMLLFFLFYIIQGLPATNTKK